MTLKDFELIAALLKAQRAYVGDMLINAMAHDFAHALKATNKQFNHDKFLRACGVSS